ncbi:UNVERIFIED_CONTAM: hypothetical protein B566_EDAN014213 [Ephemera danica]|nr:hypothetical protein B566_EDAN014213 [Ephemera danica]
MQMISPVANDNTFHSSPPSLSSSQQCSGAVPGVMRVQAPAAPHLCAPGYLVFAAGRERESNVCLSASAWVVADIDDQENSRTPTYGCLLVAAATATAAELTAAAATAAAEIAGWVSSADCRPYYASSPPVLILIAL